MASSWSCKQCTFLNPLSQKSTCQICLSPLSLPPLQSSSSSSSSSSPKWSCKACTFLNPYNRPTCELCDTRAPTSSLSSFDDLTDTAPDFAGLETSVFFPLRPCKKSRLSGSDSVGSHVVVNDSDSVVTQLGALNDSDSAVTQLEEDGSGIGLKTLKILSYNVWFREDLELRKRMNALGDLIEIHSPDIICFQEVTPEIYRIFQQSSWWKVYDCSVSKQMPSIYFCMQLSKVSVKSFSTVPFKNSEMGRELCVAEIQVEKDIPLTIATSHLESPCPAPPTWNQMYSKERVEQAKEAIAFLKKKRNVVFAGDMNWDDKLDGKFPLPDDDWIDAWTKLRPEENGWTYDTKSNKMLSGNRSLQKRLDRFVCKMNDFDISRIEMIGTDAIPGISYIKEKKVKNEVKRLELPVLPSDHYGLLLTICRR